MSIFVIETAPTGKIARKFDGQSAADVKGQMEATGNAFIIVDEATFQAEADAISSVLFARQDGAE